MSCVGLMQHVPFMFITETRRFTCAFGTFYCPVVVVAAVFGAKTVFKP
jgi:hypothetical protein